MDIFWKNADSFGGVNKSSYLCNRFWRSRCPIGREPKGVETKRSQYSEKENASLQLFNY